MTSILVEDCFVLGRLSYHEEDFYHTVMWMGQSLTLNIQNQNRTVNSAEIIDYLAFAEYKVCCTSDSVVLKATFV